MGALAKEESAGKTQVVMKVVFLLQLTESLGKKTQEKAAAFVKKEDHAATEVLQDLAPTMVFHRAVKKDSARIAKALEEAAAVEKAASQEKDEKRAVPEILIAAPPALKAEADFPAGEESLPLVARAEVLALVAAAGVREVEEAVAALVAEGQAAVDLEEANPWAAAEGANVLDARDGKKARHPRAL